MHKELSFPKDSGSKVHSLSNSTFIVIGSPYLTSGRIRILHLASLVAEFQLVTVGLHTMISPSL